MDDGCAWAFESLKTGMGFRSFLLRITFLVQANFY